MPALTTSLANWFDKPHAEPVVFLDSVSLCRNFFRSNGDRERGGDESRIGSNHRFEPIYAPFPSKDTSSSPRCDAEFDDRRALTPLFHGHINPYGQFAIDLAQPSFLDAV